MARVLVVAALVLAVVKVTTGTSYAVQFCNNNQITTPFFFDPGTANPYPSTIAVSGLNGTITDVNVTLVDFTTQGDNNSPPQHWAEDNDVMVSSPAGTGVILMSDAGGNNDTSQGPVVAADLTFDDQAANQLPADTGPLVTGTYRPVNDEDPNTGDGPDEWDPPAPAPSGTSLSAFNGQNPNGTWNLWITDDVQQATATLAGWCVDITTTGNGGSSSTTSSSTTSSSTTSSSTTSSSTSTIPTTTSTSTSTSTTTSTSTSTSTIPTTTSTSTSTSTTTIPTTSTSTSSSTTSTTSPSGTCNGLPATLTGTSGNDTLIGTAGPDVILGLGGNDTIQGLGGNDVICAGTGGDLVRGGDGDDRIFGEDGNDQLLGENGADTISGGAGADRLVGGNDNDALNGGTDFDQCFGDAGTDSTSACETISGVP